MLSLKEHGCETEYQQNYRNSQCNFSVTQTYLQNLNFRKEQKRRFVEHNPDPFEWDPEDIQSDSGSDFSCKDLNFPPALTPTQYKHEKLNRLYEKRLTDRQDSSHPGIEMNEFSSKGWAINLKPSRQSNQVVERKRLDDYYDYDSRSETESETSVVHIIEPEFVIKSSTKPSLPFANKQTQTERKSSKVSGPFLPYGYEAGSAGKGKKLIHNMRATGKIYPSALRAQRLKRSRAKANPSQTTSGRGLSGESSCASNHLQKANPQSFRLFVHSEYDDDGSPKWITEYNRSYHSHPEKDCRSANSSQVHSREFIPRTLRHSQKPAYK